jgi:apolipoprotein N-acyltransferase
MTAPNFASKGLLILCPLITGLLYFFGDGLNGNFWYLVWLAPVPVLYLASVRSGKMTFTTSFIAFFIGRLSWFSYLVSVATVVPTIIYFTLLSLFFAAMVVLTRSLAMKTKSWYAVFVFPVLFTAFEYLLIRFSPDGTALSIAYSQMNFLPLIQIASITGILGITFMITLISSTLVFLILTEKRETIQTRALICSGLIIFGVLLFGLVRSGHSSSVNQIKVGMAVMEENGHNTSDRPDTLKDNAAIDFYVRQMDSLAARGAHVILIPERALSIDPQSENRMLDILKMTAQKNNIYLITAYTNLRGKQERNSGIVMDNKGDILTEYNKKHLVVGLERQFTPGNQIGLFTLDRMQAGMAICKDLDFQHYIRAYGENKVAVLFIPAWDFIVDDWLHARMAILRGVENGFSEVRAARTGRLTISDLYGHVTAEASSAHLQNVSLTGLVSTERADTLYTRLGDWLGVLCSLLTAVIIVNGLLRSFSPQPA